IFTIVDEWANEGIVEEECGRSAAAMGDDEIGAELGLLQYSLVDRPALFEVVRVDLRPGDALAGAMLGRDRHLVQVESQHLRCRRGATREALYQEAALPTMAPDQLEAEPAELGGERVVDEKDVHDRRPPPATRSEKISASWGRQTSWLYRSCTK